jgi:endonuclease YncB( thermonuclease family)
MNRFVCIMLMLVAAHPSAEEICGTAQVLDGDSLRIAEVEIRLHGIDAPEGRQTGLLDGREWACGRSATRALTEMLGRNRVLCTWTERDTYARALATCYKDGANINAILVANGLALAYTQYTDRYISEEALARSEGLGLWRSEFVAPWVWRRTNAASKRR